jgi:hypothetical protein
VAEENSQSDYYYAKNNAIGNEQPQAVMPQKAKEKSDDQAAR